MINIKGKSNEWLVQYIKDADSDKHNTIHHTISDYEEVVHELWSRMGDGQRESTLGMGLHYRKLYFCSCHAQTFRGLKLYLSRYSKSEVEWMCGFMCE